jgi:hypothetical protein
MKKVVSTRMEPDELAKARDGLIAKGIDSEQLDNISQILRLTFYYGLLTLCDNPKSPPTHESLVFITQKMSQKKSDSQVTLQDILNAGTDQDL